MPDKIMASIVGNPVTFELKDVQMSETFLASVFGIRFVRPKIKRIIYHNPATIVFWEDGTKTVVKCMEGQQYEKYAGFCAALAKKIYGSTSKAKKISGAKG